MPFIRYGRATYLHHLPKIICLFLKSDIQKGIGGKYFSYSFIVNFKNIMKCALLEPVNHKNEKRRHIMNVSRF